MKNKLQYAKSVNGKPFSIYLDKSLRARLEKIAKNERSSMSRIIALAIEKYISNQPTTQPE